MQAIISYPNGQRSEVWVLSAEKFAMRVVERGTDDTMELTCRYDEWTNEAGVPIEFDAFVASGADDALILNTTTQRSRAAS